MSDLLKLAERVEALEGPCRETFLAAFAACFPEPVPGCEPSWREENPKQPIYHAWATRRLAFMKFVRAEAWLDAAMTLVPEGQSITLDTRAPAAATVAGTDAWVYAATPALALTAAALRARAALEAQP